MTPPIISVVARSGTGKTTLLIKLIAELKSRGYRVGAIKHDAHKFEIDHEGKDSWRMTQAGADTMVVASTEKIALVKQISPQEAPSLEEMVAAYCGDLDIILTEGFKYGACPKIEVHRQACGHPLICRGDNNDPNLIAVASDTALQIDVPVYDLDDVVSLAELLIRAYLESDV